MQHEEYGLGVVSEVDAEYTMIEFDEHGSKKFLTRLVSLQSSDPSDLSTKPRSTRANTLEPNTTLARIVSCPHCGLLTERLAV